MLHRATSRAIFWVRIHLAWALYWLGDLISPALEDILDYFPVGDTLAEAVEFTVKPLGHYDEPDANTQQEQEAWSWEKANNLS